MRNIQNNIIFRKGFLLSLRGLGILSKFLLTFLITKKISLDFQGTFSLVSTTITLLVLFIGLDFYVYSNKLTIKTPSKAIFYLKNNLFFYLLVYILVVPIFFLVFNSVIQDSSFSIILLIIVVALEHLGQEFFRMYIALQKVYFANVLLFIRTGLWAIVVVGYLIFQNNEINLSINELLLCWAISAFISLILSFWYFPKINLFFRQKIDFTWIKNGIRVSSYMFLATVFLKVVEYSDRYIIDYFMNKEAVGIYTFYYQLANLGNVIIFTLYISFIYPKIMREVYNNDWGEVKKHQKKLKVSSMVIILGLTLFYALTLSFFLSYVNRPQLYEYKWLLFGLLFSFMILNLSFASHYTLIAKNMELKILKITFISFIVSVLCNLFFIKNFGIAGALVAQILANTVLFVFKEYEIRKLATY